MRLCGLHFADVKEKTNMVRADYFSFQLWEKFECLQNMVVKLTSSVFFLKFEAKVSPTMSVCCINDQWNDQYFFSFEPEKSFKIFIKNIKNLFCIDYDETKILAKTDADHLIQNSNFTNPEYISHVNETIQNSLSAPPLFLNLSLISSKT